MFLSFMWPGSKDKQVYKKAIQQMQKISAAVASLKESDQDKQALICYAVLSNPDFNAAMKKYIQSDSKQPSNSAFSHKDEFEQELSRIGNYFGAANNWVFHTITDSKSKNDAVKLQSSVKDQSELQRFLEGNGTIKYSSVEYHGLGSYEKLSEAFIAMPLDELSKIVGLTSLLSMSESNQKFLLSQKYGVSADYKVSVQDGKISVVANVPAITVNPLSVDIPNKFIAAMQINSAASAEVIFTINPKAANPNEQVTRTINIKPADPSVIAGLSKIREMELAKGSPNVSRSSTSTNPDKHHLSPT